MAVSFTIDVEKISRSSAIMGALARNFKMDEETLVSKVIRFFTPKSAKKAIQQATSPTHVRYDAVMDGKTSEVCRGLNGTVWPIDSDEIKVPPLHYNCRSSLLYFRK